MFPNYPQSVIAQAERSAAARVGVPLGLMPTFPSDGYDVAASAANSHRLTDTLLGTERPTPPTVHAAFATITGALADAVSGATASAEVSALLGRVVALRDEVVQFLDAQRAGRVAALQAEHGALYRDCRAALDRLRECQSEASAAQMRINAMGESVAGARAALHAVEGRQPSAASYPTAAEMSAWQAELFEARQANAKQQGIWDAAQAELARAEAALQKAQREFQRLSEQEQDLRRRIAAGAPSEAIIRERVSEPAAHVVPGARVQDAEVPSIR